MYNTTTVKPNRTFKLELDYEASARADQVKDEGPNEVHLLPARQGLHTTKAGALRVHGPRGQFRRPGSHSRSQNDSGSDPLAGDPSWTGMPLRAKAVARPS